jgi:hypothetical protein
MWASGVIDLGLSQAEAWSLTPAEFSRLHDFHLARERRLDARAALIACYIANMAGKMRKEGTPPLTVDDLLGVARVPTPDADLAALREATMNQESKLINRLRMTDPQSEFMLSREVLNSIAQGRGRWDSYGSREKMLEALGDDAMEPMVIVRAMNGGRG